MKTGLSALVDGEVRDDEVSALMAAVKKDEGLRDTWREYHLIGDVLRGEPRLDADMAAQVMGALEDEPVVLAPPRQRSPWHGSALALAASVAGVAVVGWLAFAPQTASHEPLAAAKIERLALSPEAARDMQDYLAAHQAQASDLHLRGGTQNIRTVSVVGAAR